MANSDSLNRWQKGDGFSASHLNEVIDLIQGDGDFTSARGVDGKGLSIYTSNGTVIGKPAGLLTGRKFIGKIVNTGPSNEADFTDFRYYVKAQYLQRTGTVSVIPVIADDKSIYGKTSTPLNASTPAYINVTTAFNLAEFINGTHYLQYGQMVWCYEIRERPYDQTGANNKQAMYRWVFYTPDIGNPQYQAQVLTGVAQNQRGWRFPTAHSYL